MRKTYATCEHCGKGFSAFVKSAKRFCGRECWQGFRLANRRTATCEGCGKTFHPSKRAVTACSLRCAQVKRRADEVPPADVAGARWIRMNRGFVLVDASDYDALAEYAWTAIPKYGARRLAHLPDGSKKSVVMHRQILGLEDDVEVDHRNGNRFDNRRENLRPASRRDQSGNTRKRSGSASSRFKGVWWGANVSRWEASISSGRTRVFLGCFMSEEEAARAYDAAAREVFGAFACVNFPREGERSAVDGSVRQ